MTETLLKRTKIASHPSIHLNLTLGSRPALGHGMDQDQPSAIIWTVWVILTYIMQNTKFQGHRYIGSEEDFLRILPYIRIAAMLFMWPGPFEQACLYYKLPRRLRLRWTKKLNQTPFVDKYTHQIKKDRIAHVNNWVNNLHFLQIQDLLSYRFWFNKPTPWLFWFLWWFING